MQWIWIIYFFILGVASDVWLSSDEEKLDSEATGEEGGGCVSDEHPDDSDNYEPRELLPKYVNWMDKGAVREVKDERKCRSSWAFSATGALEAQYFLKTGKRLTLSEQHLIDCSGIETRNRGCSGGTHFNANHYVMSRDNPRRGVATAAAYPNLGHAGKCRFNKTTTPIGGSMIFSKRVFNSEESLQRAVATIGPISAKMHVTRAFYNFRNNSSIFFDDKCAKNKIFDQYVLVVGYGVTKNNVKYWIIKNSWGTGWGKKGFALLARDRNNTCGITDDAIYPIVK